MLNRKGDDYYSGVRTDIADFISGRTLHVLDIGCAYGVTGEMLKRRGVKEVIGVEIDPHAHKEASKRLDRVFLGDIQEIYLPFKEGYFDYIIYADVLEHLKDPWSVLEKHRPLLKDSGAVIASIPNVRHYRVVKKLLRGRWDYQRKGVLDSAHIRFFTLNSIRKMFCDAGYEIDTLRYKISASKVKKMLNRVFCGKLNELLSEQFIIKAVKRHR